MSSCACPTCTLNCPRQVSHLTLARGVLGVSLGLQINYIKTKRIFIDDALHIFRDYLMALFGLHLR
jgi:hypothetical protein